MAAPGPFVLCVSGMVALCAVGASEVRAQSVSVEYELKALAQPSRFEYSYKITNLSLDSALDWFSIAFAPDLYDEATLAYTSTGLDEWAEQFLASRPGLPAEYDAYKFVGPALGIGDSQAGFTVAFTWLGSGLPVDQVFTIWDSTTFDVLDSGLTAPIPEPSTTLLAMIGLAAVLAASRRSRLGNRRSSVETTVLDHLRVG